MRKIEKIDPLPKKYYFGYGSNMDLDQMACRCPDSEFVGVASLENYRFRINARGFATIIPDHESTVHGTLWLISEIDENTLDGYEGVAGGFYWKELVAVDLDGETIDALTYIAANDEIGDHDGYCGYMRKVHNAAIFHQLPIDYLEELETWIDRIYGSM